MGQAPLGAPRAAGWGREELGRLRLVALEGNEGEQRREGEVKNGHWTRCLRQAGEDM